MAEVQFWRGTTAILRFAVLDDTGAAYDLTSDTLTWTATDGTRTLTKTTAAGITVDSPATAGTGYVTIDPADTSGWPETTVTLRWGLTIDDAVDLYTVAVGSISVAAAVPSAPISSAYLDEADLVSVLSSARLAEFTSESGDNSDPNVLTVALADVDDTIDAALAGTYTVPITDPTSIRVLRPHAKILLKWALLVRRNLTPDEATRTTYEMTQRFLRDLQKGDAKLAPTAAKASIPTPDADAGTASFGSNETVALDLAGYL